MTSTRKLTPFDRLIKQADHVLQTLTPDTLTPERASPAEQEADAALTDRERKQIAGLMRINHTGEVCAQALYHGQSTTAKLDQVRAAMEQAAREETDHLVWCEERIRSLGSHTSKLNPLFYGLSFTLGAAAGLAGDRWSLGFVNETEKQVCHHLDNHLKKIPFRDKKSRAILKQMRIDEAQHAQAAVDAGARSFPKPVKKLMQLASKVMTTTTYRV